MESLPNDTPTTTAWKAGYEVGVAAERARIVAALDELVTTMHATADDSVPDQPIRAQGIAFAAGMIERGELS